MAQRRRELRAAERELAELRCQEQLEGLKRALANGGLTRRAAKMWLRSVEGRHRKLYGGAPILTPGERAQLLGGKK